MALILVADDDVHIASMLQDHLQERAHQVVLAHDGMTASLKIQELRPQLVIMDIQMPGAYGTSVYHTLEQAGVTRTTPCIFITGVPVEQAKKIVPAARNTRFFPKPLDLAMLDEAIKELLGDAPGP